MKNFFNKMDFIHLGNMKYLLMLLVTITMVKQEIILQAKANNVNVETALRIAKCESSYNAEAKNKRSSATGVYQWTKGSWEWVEAEGDRTDYKQNIAMFMKFYKKYPQWWVCK